MTILYSGAVGGFYDSRVHENPPEDCIVISEEHYQSLLDGQSDGMMICPDVNGFPTLRKTTPEPITTEQVDVRRKMAYADPVTGSDSLFSEAYRMQMMGEEGWELVRDKAVARFAEIQDQHPWPEEPAA